ncbi:hypothetical protein ILUMI_07505 [Ignelater luminosus]|uniref:Large ribosomal subunit protein uL10m n=1 Tax=Ignelater luminosus TaxID=2038154 RepID=A0A8K0D869_IGNLU|nr:hypothetical protein ILUMI_07505 [Ignelater luminosus]
MSLICRKAFLLERCKPFLQPKRLKSKINVQKPKAPHHEKATFLAFTKPIFLNPNYEKRPIELCTKGEQLWKKDEDNPFQRIIAGELLRWFQSSRLVVFYHMNPMSSDDQFKAYALFQKQKMHFKNYGKETLRMALEGTPYESVLDFYISRNMIVFSPELEVKKLLKVSKKFPQLILLAAIFEGKFISKDELMEYSLIPNLQTAQAGLVQTLDRVGSNLIQNLNSQQNILVGQLQERAKQLEEK